MNFFEQQAAARRRTGWLVFYYGIALALIVVAVYVAVLLIVVRGNAHGGHLAAGLWRPDLFLWVAVCTLGLVGGGTLCKIAALRSGGAAVARMLGGQPIDPHTAVPEERRLLNVVEEMAIASGVPVPPVYVLDQEDGINAFAAGFSTSDAVITVTRGTLSYLNRDELQGVVAHEFSHVFNGDMRLNLKLIGTLFGIQLIALIGYWTLRIVGRSSGGSRSRSKKGGGAGAIVLLGVALLIIGYVGVFFARLIQAAVSRQREFLADASAVQFTRNPDGIAGALKKIGGLVEGSRVTAPQAEAASHLFFANGLAPRLTSLFATHPPLVERIRLIDPAFNGEFPKVARLAAEMPLPDLSGPALTPSPAPPPLPVAAAVAMTPRQATLRTGTLSPELLAGAATLLASIPTALRDAARGGLGAQAVCFGLLLSADAATRGRQTTALAGISGVLAEAERLEQQLHDLPMAARLPLGELALPGLRTLSQAQYSAFRDAAFALAAADEEIDLFEYAILRMVTRNLDPLYGFAKRTVVQYYSLTPLMSECAVLLSAMARFGATDESAAAQSFAQGWAALQAGDAQPLLPADQCGLDTVDHALDRLAAVPPLLKERVLHACAATAASDSQLTAEEAEMLRAVADSLQCPLPPFLPHATQEAA